MADSYDIAILGAGAAGIGAGRRLAQADASFVILEARARIGGRAFTVVREAPLDLGAGWLHSGDRNVLAALAEAAGFEIDRSAAPWRQRTAAPGMSEADRRAFGEAFERFERRIEAEAENDGVNPASRYLEPGGRWNAMLNAVFTYISGAALDGIDARDYARYEDTGVNWRVAAGYGALLAALGDGLPVRLETEARGVDHSGAQVRVDTSRGAVEARAAIVTLPTSLLGGLPLTPDLPDKRDAALALPLGAAEKVHFALAQAEEFSPDSRLFARTDSTDTGAYHVRPLGRPLIEAYFGGALARGLAQAGPEAMAAFAKEELASLLGAHFPQRLTTLAVSSWSTDAHARGAYSYAVPGRAEARAVLAAAHEQRLFFAGEACSRTRYSTVHGAFETGWAAAEAALEAIKN